MVIALPALWLIAVSIAFYIAAKLILTPAIVGILRRIPAIGRFIAGAADSVVHSVENAIGRWLRPQLATMVRWLTAAAEATILIPGAIDYYSNKVEDALKYLVEHKIAQIVHGITNPIQRALSATATAVVGLRHDLGALDRRLTRSIEEGLRDLSAELLRRFAQGIDRLRRDVYGTTIPALEKAIADAFRGAEADIAGVGKDVAGIAQRLADLAKRLDIPLSTIEQLIAAVGVVATIEALDTLVTCKGKLKTLCQYDPGLWDDFLLGALALLAFPGLREMTKMGASLLEELSGSVTELAGS